MLRWRLLLGVVFTSILVALCWLDAQAQLPGTYLMPLALLLGVVSADELVGLMRARDLQPQRLTMLTGTALVIAANAVPIFWPDNPLGKFGWPLMAMALALLVTFLEAMRRYERPGGNMEQLGLTTLGIAYAGLLFACVWQIRLLGPEEELGKYGLAALASLIAVVKSGDVGAYTVGRLFGRHKMAPVLSPGKTWEGAVGGLVFACVASYLTNQVMAVRLFGPPHFAWGWLVFGLLVGPAGMYGDLAESLMKRDTGRKDSSTWMPGFGGVLDLLDSILFAAPVSYLLWVFRIVGP